MSFSVASYFTCSPRASSASATSASSPTEGAPPCCHSASPLSTPLHRKTNRKRRPLLQRTRCGAVPSAADRWPSSNDSQPHNSNSVLHRSWPRLHEITRPHTALSARFRASRRSVSPLHPDIFFLSPPRLTSAIDSSLHRCAGCYSTGLDDSRELLHPSLAPFNLHKSRVRRASGFLLTAFSNATPTPSFSLEHSSRRRVRKSTSVTRCPSSSLPGCVRSSAKIGSSTPNHPSADPSTCCSIWAAILIASPSPTIAWSHWRTARLPFAGVTRLTTMSKS